MEAELLIDPDGKITCVYQDDITDALKDLGPVLNKRACFVEPFWADPSRWSVDAKPILNLLPPLHGNFGVCMASGLIGVFDSRAEALAIEAEWLRLYLPSRYRYIWDQHLKVFK